MLYPCKVDKVTSTGAAMNISLGFTPVYVIVHNETTGKSFEWFGGADGDAAGDAILHTWSTGVITKITSNGIDAYTGSTTVGSEASVGFTMGTDVAGSTSDVIRYAAFRGLQDA